MVWIKTGVNDLVLNVSVISSRLYKMWKEYFVTFIYLYHSNLKDHTRYSLKNQNMPNSSCLFLLGREYNIPSPLQRLLAEMVDFFILFFIKATIILSVMQLSGIKSVPVFLYLLLGSPNVFTNAGDPDVLMSDSGTEMYKGTKGRSHRKNH